MRALELNRARTAARQAAREVSTLDAQVVTISKAVAEALPDLEARLVTLYKLGRGQHARMLLSASDARTFAQGVRLVTALADQDERRVAAHRERLATLREARERAGAAQERQKQLEQAAAKARVEAERAVARHVALVRDVDTRRDLNARLVGELQASQERLQNVLNGAAASTDVVELPIAPFKGDLPWPARGLIRQRFGQSLRGRPALRGIEIGAAAGTPVRAVHDGTVAYADLFTGLGRLVILEHGGRQAFTLYGYLADVAVKPGTRVERGTQVGTAGLAPSGVSGLYFELRIDGRPVDPLQWLVR
ncbi:MAG: murein hydrolase activator EnvC [Vicinamibacterales bacterium]